MPDGSFGNSAIFVDDTAKVVGEHTKSHLYGAMDNDRFTSGPQATTILEYRGVRITILICMELEFPEPARLAALAGAQLIAVLTSNMETPASTNTWCGPGRGRTKPTSPM
jgi:predicted amidohydrolase